MWTGLAIVGVIFLFFMLAPKQVGEPGGGVGAAPTAPIAPASAPSAPSTTSTPAAPASPAPSAIPPQSGTFGGGFNVPSQPSTPSTPTATQTPTTVQQQNAATLRDQLAPYLGGLVNTGQFQDDTAFAQNLAQLLRTGQQNSQFAQLGQQVAPYHAQFQTYLAEQQKAEAAKKAAEQKWYTPPEYNPDWRNMVEIDANGNMVAKAGFDPLVPQKLQAYNQSLRNNLDKFFQDPIGFIKPGLEQMIKEEAAKIAQQTTSGYEVKQQATQFVAQNSGWLHEQNNGQPVFDASGNKVLSAAGRIFQGHYQAKLAFAKKLADATGNQDILRLYDTPEMYEECKALTRADLLAEQQRATTATPATVAPPAPAAPTPAAPGGTNRLQTLSDATKVASQEPRRGRSGLPELRKRSQAAMKNVDIPSPN
jgi:hypothetical protein